MQSRRALTLALLLVGTVVAECGAAERDAGGSAEPPKPARDGWRDAGLGVSAKTPAGGSSPSAR